MFGMIYKMDSRQPGHVSHPGGPGATIGFAVRSPTTGLIAMSGIVACFMVFVLVTWLVRPKLVWTFQGLEPGVPSGVSEVVWIGSPERGRSPLPGINRDVDWIHLVSEGNPSRPQGVAFPLKGIMPSGVGAFACTMRTIAVEESTAILCLGAYQADTGGFMLYNEDRYKLPTYAYSLGRVNSSLPVIFNLADSPATYFYIGSAEWPVNLVIVDALIHDVSALAGFDRS